MVNKPILNVIFDGECPFCRLYTHITVLRSKLEVRLYDARDEKTFTQFPEARNYDLDKGMLVQFRGRWYHGSDAVQQISNLVSNAPLSFILRSDKGSSRVYPWLRRSRRIVLTLLGKRPISR